MNLNFETTSQEPEVKEVEKLSDGSVHLPYIKETSMGSVDFDFRIKKNKEGKTIIENKTKESPQNKGYILNNDKTFILDTSSSSAFAKSLGQALDAYVGKGRPSLAQEKREKVYKLAWFEKQLLQEAEDEQIKKTIQEINILSDEIFKWDAEKKELKFEYNIGYGINEKVIYSRIKELPGGKIKFTMEAGYLWSIAKKNSIEKIFDKENLRKELPTFINEILSKGIDYKRVFWKEKKHIARESTRNNAVQKAIKATEVFERYTK